MQEVFTVQSKRTHMVSYLMMNNAFDDKNFLGDRTKNQNELSTVRILIHNYSTYQLCGD
jgi:hypothetical protein